MNRRELLYGTGLGLVSSVAARAGVSASAPIEEEPKPKVLDLPDYQPVSMLHVRETHVEKSRYPVIDFHTHISFSAKGEKGVPMVAERRYNAAPEELIPVMDSNNLRTMVNLTGGYGAGLAETVKKYDKLFPDRFYTFTEPAYSQILEPDYPRKQAEAIEQAHRDGARGLKVLKTLGLYLSDNITTGKLIKIDDPRFDPMWDVCGQLKMPVAIHISDPSAFFLPTDRFNERYEELNNHPDWSSTITTFHPMTSYWQPGTG